LTKDIWEIVVAVNSTYAKFPQKMKCCGCFGALPLFQNRMQHTPSRLPTRAPSQTAILAQRSRQTLNLLEDNRPIQLQAESFDDDDQLGFLSTSGVEAQPEPEVSDAGPVSVNTRLEYSALPRGSTKQVFGLVTLTASAASQHSSAATPNVHRQPMDLVCVLDVSGSMTGQKISLVQQAMRFIIDNAQSQDRVSIVTFNHYATRPLRLRRMDAEGKSDATAATLRLCASGGTDIASGLHTGITVMESRRQKNKVAAVLLLTDGQDRGSHRKVFSLVERLPQAGCGLYAFGLGADHDAVLLSKIAEQATTPFTFVEDVEHIRQAFAGAVGGLGSVVAQQIELSLECKAVLTAVHTPFPVQRCSDTKVLVKIPDIFNQEKKDILVELSVPAEPKDDEGAQHTTLLEASAKYEEVRGGSMLQTPRVAMVMQTCDELQPEAEPDEEVSAQRERVEVAQALKEASAHSDQGNYEAAQQVISNTQQSIRSKKTATQMTPTLLLELEDASSRMASQSTWELGGQAEVRDATQTFLTQRCTNVSVSRRSSVIKESKTLYCSRSSIEMIDKL